MAPKQFQFLAYVVVAAILLCLAIFVLARYKQASGYQKARKTPEGKVIGGDLKEGEAEGNLTTELEGVTENCNPGCVSRNLLDYKPCKSTNNQYSHPSVVHYVAFAKDNTNIQLIFSDYISMLSVYTFLSPETIMVHTNTGLSGVYWESMKDWKGTNVVVNKIERVSSLSGRKVGRIEHEADYTKVKTIYEKGGMTFDFDVIVVNGTKWKQRQSISECVLSYQNDGLLNIGSFSCVQHSSFMHDWLHNYHVNYNGEWIYNSGTVPANLLKKEDTCYNVYVDNSIAINPGWSHAEEWVTSKQKVDWRKKSAAHYFSRGLKANNIDENLLTQNSSLGELVRYVFSFKPPPT